MQQFRLQHQRHCIMIPLALPAPTKVRIAAVDTFQIGQVGLVHDVGSHVRAAAGGMLVWLSHFLDLVTQHAITGIQRVIGF